MAGTRNSAPSRQNQFIHYIPAVPNSCGTKSKPKPSMVSSAVIGTIARMEAGIGPLAPHRLARPDHLDFFKAPARLAKRQDSTVSTVNFMASVSGACIAGPQSRRGGQRSNVGGSPFGKISSHTSEDPALQASAVGSGPSMRSSPSIQQQKNELTRAEHPILVTESDDESTPNAGDDDALSSDDELPDLATVLSTKPHGAMLESRHHGLNRAVSPRRLATAGEQRHAHLAAGGHQEPGVKSTSLSDHGSDDKEALCSRAQAGSLGTHACANESVADQGDGEHGRLLRAQSRHPKHCESADTSTACPQEWPDEDKKPSQKLARLPQEDQPPACNSGEEHDENKSPRLHADATADAASPTLLTTGANRDINEGSTLSQTKLLRPHGHELKVAVRSSQRKQGFLEISALVKGDLQRVPLGALELALMRRGAALKIHSINSITYTPGLPSSNECLITCIASSRKHRQPSASGRSSPWQAEDTDDGGSTDATNENSDNDRNDGRKSNGGSTDYPVHARRGRASQRWTANENRVLRKWSGKAADLPNILKLLNGRTEAAVMQRWNSKCRPTVKKRRRKAY